MSHEIKVYCEVIEWRKAISRELGTTSGFTRYENGVHWWSSDSRGHFDSIDLGIQNFSRSPSMDTYCSLYSLYNELQFKYNIPDLMRGFKVGQYKYNKSLLKLYLPLVCKVKWPKLKKWSNWAISKQKEHFLQCVKDL